MTARRRSEADVEEALEQLFRLGANKRFDARQAEHVGAAVTRAGYAVLRCLGQEQMGVAALADACVMDAAAASRQVERLVSDGLVRRQVDAHDARAVNLVITDEGRHVYEAVTEYRVDFTGNALRSWDERELADLAATIRRLAGDLAG